MSDFHVSLKKVVDDSYDIAIGAALAESLKNDLLDGLLGKIQRFAIVTDDLVKPLYADQIAALLSEAGFETEIFAIPHGEKNKTRENKAWLEDAMLSRGFRRDCGVIAVGGGVVTDLAGFTAGTFGRGVPFVNYATTLLAAADASVGGKTAVDTPLATNLIGLFYQPKKVYIDVKAWETLPERELRSGLAETIKHACMADADFFSYLEAHLDTLLSVSRQGSAQEREAQSAVCMYVAEKNCQIKYQVVEQDEKETTGMREILNLGHTVGRAVETVSDYRLLHGEAVAIGLMFQARLGEKGGYLSAGEVSRMKALLEKAGLPVEIPGYIDREALVKKLYTDKKVRNGAIRFVFQKGIGQMMRFEDGSYARAVSETEVRSVL
ncbi:MAG: 3-dehydroquinate synthase [Lachnospiraceae bacterium]|nr:3-dehydroquinate synthase [Lachnospiraceae bacterium]